MDLAGADYDPRSPLAGPAKKESIEINKSLLALKTCLRSLARSPGAPLRPPFRQSKLTRLLEDALSPRSHRASENAATVMLVKKDPLSRQERMTINSLRYGQLFAFSAYFFFNGRPKAFFSNRKPSLAEIKKSTDKRTENVFENLAYERAAFVRLCAVESSVEAASDSGSQCSLFIGGFPQRCRR